MAQSLGGGPPPPPPPPHTRLLGSVAIGCCYCVSSAADRAGLNRAPCKGVNLLSPLPGTADRFQHGFQHTTTQPATALQLEGSGRRIVRAPLILEDLDLTVTRAKLPWPCSASSGCGARAAALRLDLHGLDSPDRGRILRRARTSTALPPARRQVAMVCFRATRF